MQALYQAEVAGIDIGKALENIFEEEKFLKETRDFSSALAEGAWNKKAEIDKLITAYSKDWKIGRMGGLTGTYCGWHCTN